MLHMWYQILKSYYLHFTYFLDYYCTFFMKLFSNTLASNLMAIYEISTKYV